MTGEAILGASVSTDLFAGVWDIVGGGTGAYGKELQRARRIAFEEMDREAERLGADAILRIDIDYETVGPKGGMLMVNVSGTAVALK